MSIRTMLWVGGTLLVVGWVLALLGTVHIVPQSFLLAFISVLCLIVGTIFGLFGVLGAFRRNRHGE